MNIRSFKKKWGNEKCLRFSYFWNRPRSSGFTLTLLTVASYIIKLAATVLQATMVQGIYGWSPGEDNVSFSCTLIIKPEGFCPVSSISCLKYLLKNILMKTLYCSLNDIHTLWHSENGIMLLPFHSSVGLDGCLEAVSINMSGCEEGIHVLNILEFSQLPSVTKQDQMWSWED